MAEDCYYGVVDERAHRALELFETIVDDNGGIIKDVFYNGQDKVSVVAEFITFDVNGETLPLFLELLDIIDSFESTSSEEANLIMEITIDGSRRENK